MSDVLIAHPKTKDAVQYFISSPSHALAIIGNDGAGKSYIADYIASALLKVSQAKLLSHAYIYKLDAAQSDTGIDTVRELQKKLNLQVPGTQTIKRIVILENTEFLRHEAQNALLKTLEEPPVDTVLLLTVTRKDRVLSTIHSRTQELKILPINLTSAQELLGQEYSEAEIVKAYRMSGGEIGLLLALLDEKHDHELVQAINRAKDLLKMSRYERICMVDLIAKDKNIQPIRLLDAIYRLLDAALKQQITQPQAHTRLDAAQKRLNLVLKALKDIELGVNTKLTISRLFYNL